MAAARADPERPPGRVRRAEPAGRRPSAAARAGRWCCTARPAWARRRCSSTWPGTRPTARRRARPGSSRRWNCRSPRCTSSAGRCSTSVAPCPPRSGTRCGSSFGISAEPTPDRFLIGLAVLGPAVRRRRAAAAAVPGRRPAVARPRVRAGARVRRPPARRGVDRPGLRDQESRRRPGRAAGTAGRGAAPTRTRGCCSTRRWPARSTAGSGTRSSPRPGATRWRCSNCPAS